MNGSEKSANDSHLKGVRRVQGRGEEELAAVFTEQKLTLCAIEHANDIGEEMLRQGM